MVSVLKKNARVQASATLLPSTHTTSLSSVFYSMTRRDGRRIEDFTDLSFVCRDGRIRAHQCVVASQSRFLGKMMECRQSLEFDQIDWSEAVAFLMNRRKSDEEITVMLPDFERRTVKTLLSCFYTGEMMIETKTQFEYFKSLVDCLAIDSVDIAKLDIAKSSRLAVDETTINQMQMPSPLKRKVLKTASDLTAVSPKQAKTTAVASTSFSQQPQVERPQTQEPQAEQPQSQPPQKQQPQTPRSASKGRSTRQKTHHCEICNNPMQFDSQRRMNLYKYANHLLSHFQVEHYSELPVLEKYFCPYSGCDLKFLRRFTFLHHLCWTHSEFFPRFSRRLKETDVDAKERSQLMAVLKTLQEDPAIKLSIKGTMPNVCGELDVFEAYEGKCGDPENITCSDCNRSFKCPEYAVTHLCRNHEDHRFSEIVGLNSKFAGGLFAAGSNLMQRDVYRCPRLRCGKFSTPCKSLIIAHFGIKHGIFDGMGLEKLAPGLDRTKLFSYAIPKVTNETLTVDEANFEFVSCDANSSEDDVSDERFLCVGCGQNFKLFEANYHFETVAHEVGNAIKCKRCDCTAICENLDQFRSWYNAHDCEDKVVFVDVAKPFPSTSRGMTSAPVPELVPVRSKGDNGKSSGAPVKPRPTKDVADCEVIDIDSD